MFHPGAIETLLQNLPNSGNTATSQLELYFGWRIELSDIARLCNSLNNVTQAPHSVRHNLTHYQYDILSRPTKLVHLDNRPEPI
jgi:hypothetical protein